MRLPFLRRTSPLSCPEQPITRVAQAGENIAQLIKSPIQGGAVDEHIGMCAGEAPYPFGRGDEAKKPNPSCSSALEGCDGGCSAASRGEHRVQQEKISFRRIAGDLEVVIDRLEGVVIAIETDMTHPRRRDETRNAFNHAKPGAQNGNQREFLSADPFPRRSFQRCLDGRRFECQLARCLIGYERGDLIDEFLEDLGRCGAIAQ